MVPYCFLLLLFLLCNLFALMPKVFFPTAFLPTDFATLQLCMLVLFDFVMDMSWLPLGHVLEYAGSLAIGCQTERWQRRAIRKSESLNALSKALIRCISIVSTICLALQQLGPMFILPTIVYLGTTARFTFAFLKVSAQVIQDRKADRDDAL
jgi:hypothetical protein